MPWSKNRHYSLPITERTKGTLLKCRLHIGLFPKELYSTVFKKYASPIRINRITSEINSQMPPPIHFTKISCLFLGYSAL